jgi:hypothetical protein
MAAARRSDRSPPLQISLAFGIAAGISIFLARKNLGANFLLQDFSDLPTRQVGPDVHLLRRLDAADTPP